VKRDTLVRDHTAPDGVREPTISGASNALRRWVRQNMAEWFHTCPDGTQVETVAQFIVTTGTTLYRWTVDGRPARPSSSRRPIDEEPPCIRCAGDPTTTQEKPPMTSHQERSPARRGEVVTLPSSAVTVVDAPVPAGALSISTGQEFWSNYQKAALVQLGIEGAPNADLAIYLNVCQRTGLDPFVRQIYMIGRNETVNNKRTKKWTIQTSIDGFRLIAERTGRYEGQTEQQWCGPDGVWRDVWAERVPPVAARIGVYKRGFRAPVYAVANWKEFAVYKANGKDLTRFWSRMPSHMLSKVAEALALRKAFPQDLSGLYTTDEMDRSNYEGGVETPDVVIPQQEDRTASRPHDVRVDEPQGASAASDAADAVADAAAEYTGRVYDHWIDAARADDWDGARAMIHEFGEPAEAASALRDLYALAVAANNAGRCPAEVVVQIMSDGELAAQEEARARADDQYADA
jgi:phage recombination protein Bet